MKFFDNDPCDMAKVSALVAGLSSNEWKERAHAARAAWNCLELSHKLVECLVDTEGAVVAAAIGSLALLRADDAADRIFALADSPNPQVRLAVCFFAGELGFDNEVSRFFGDSNPEVELLAISQARKLGIPLPPNSKGP
jgi:HEAT repeat protein